MKLIISYKKTVLIFLLFYFLLAPLQSLGKNIKGSSSEELNKKTEELIKDLEIEISTLSDRLIRLEEQVKVKQEVIDKINSLEEKRLLDKIKIVDFWMMFWSVGVVVFGVALGFFSFLNFRRFEKDFKIAQDDLKIVNDKTLSIVNAQQEIKKEYESLQALSFLNRGIYHFENGKLENAKYFLKKSISIEKTCDALYQYARTYEKNGADKLLQAIDYLNQSIKFDSKFIPAYELRRNYKKRLGHFLEAEQDDLKVKELLRQREEY